MYGGCISQPWELLQVGVFPRVPPGSRGRPRGMSGPTAPSQPESPAPGDRGGRCGGRCGAPSCWCGQRDPGSAVRARRSRPAGAPLPRPLLGRGGNPVSTPPSLPSPPPHPGGPTPLWPCLPRAAAGRDSAPPQAAPGGPGIPSVTHGTPLASPGSWGPACVRTSASSCIPALRLPLRAGRAAACGHPVGDPAVVTRDGRIPRVGVFAPPPSGRPRPTVPRPAGSSLFPRRVSHPLRCVWVISLDSTTGSCCRARLPDVGRAALEGGVCCGPGVGKVCVRSSGEAAVKELFLESKGLVWSEGNPRLRGVI